MYADDVIVYVSNENCDTAKRLLQEDTEKSMTMLFGSRHRIEQCGELQIKMGTDLLPNTDTYSYLGVELVGPLTVNHGHTQAR